MASNASFAIFPQLQAGNFNNWIFRLECLLGEKDLLDTLTSQKDDKQIEDFTKKDARAKNIIVQCIPDKHLNIVKECPTAHKMIQILKELYQRKSIISIIHLRRKLLNVKQTPTENLEDYFHRFDGLVRELESAQESLNERDKIACLLTGLHEKYDTVITAIDTISTEIKLDFVKRRLLNQELKLTEKVKHKDSNEMAFQITCYNCNKPGHIARDCRTQGRGNRRGQYQRSRGQVRGRGRGYQRTPYRALSSEQSSDGNVAENQISFTAFSSESVSVKSESESSNISFVIDSGATENLLQDQYIDYVTDIQKLSQDVCICVANKEYLRSRLRGKLNVTYNNIKIGIDVLLVKNLSHNLLSVKQMTKKNFNVNFKDNRISNRHK